MVEKTPQEEKKTEDGSSSEEEAPRIARSSQQFPTPKTREELTVWSRMLHRRGPRNLYYKIKIPWKTILVAFIFFVLGSAFLIWGAHECQTSGIGAAYEKIILGLILFIPGSYHTFLTI